MISPEYKCLRIMRHLTKSTFGDAAMPIVTRIGDYGMCWILLAAGMLLSSRTRRAGIQVLLSLLIESLLCNGLLKPLIARKRPFLQHPSLPTLIERPTDGSFPSGHTGASVAAALTLYITGSHLWKPAFPLAVLITYSRLYLCVHYVTDILGGITAGIASALAAARLMRYIPQKK